MYTVYMYSCSQPYSCTYTILANPTLVYARFWSALLLYMHGSGQSYSCICTILANPTLVLHATIWFTALISVRTRYTFHARYLQQGDMSPCVYIIHIHLYTWGYIYLYKYIHTFHARYSQQRDMSPCIYTYTHGDIFI